MLFWIVRVVSRLSQHGVGEVLIPLRHCWCLSAFVLAVDRFILVGHRTAQLCFGLLMRCFFGAPPVRPPAFRRVCGLESYSRTSEETNHHRQSVSDTRVPRYQLHHEDDLQRRPAHAKPDFNWLSGPEMEPESAHVVSAVSVSSNVAMQHHPGNIHQYFATPRYSGTPCYVLIQMPNVTNTISKRWRSRKPSILTRGSRVFNKII